LESHQNNGSDYSKAMGSSDIFLEAEWRFLAMLNYEVDSALLQKFVPPGTALDRWNGKVLISLVGFRFLKTKVFGIPFPFHRNFEEVNLRFYVQRHEGNEVRRGVVFIKEIVPRWMIATVARRVYNENYVALPMSHKIDSSSAAGIVVEYGWRSHSRWNSMSLTTTGGAVLPEFITEHYWGYASQRNGGCMEYRVAHPSWRVWNVRDAKLGGDLTELYGRELAGALSGAPVSAFLAEGSMVEVHRGRRL
jgi:uncharacterized protein YqjF (DUF2071 family)